LERMKTTVAHANDIAMLQVRAASWALLYLYPGRVLTERASIDLLLHRIRSKSSRSLWFVRTSARATKTQYSADTRHSRSSAHKRLYELFTVALFPVGLNNVVFVFVFVFECNRLRFGPVLNPSWYASLRGNRGGKQKRRTPKPIDARRAICGCGARKRTLKLGSQ
jgi:hypothetical protein